MPKEGNMEIRKSVNPKFILLNGVLVKNDTLEKLFELDEELADIDGHVGLIQCDVLKELGDLADWQLDSIEIGATKEIFNLCGRAGYRVTRVSKNFCIAKMLEVEFVFNKRHDHIEQQEEEEEAECLFES